MKSAMGVLEFLPALARQSKYAVPRLNLSLLLFENLAFESLTTRAAARDCFRCGVSVLFQGFPFFKNVCAKPLFGMFVRREASFRESTPSVGDRCPRDASVIRTHPVPQSQSKRHMAVWEAFANTFCIHVVQACFHPQCASHIHIGRPLVPVVQPSPKEQ